MITLLTSLFTFLALFVTVAVVVIITYIAMIKLFEINNNNY